MPVRLGVKTSCPSRTQQRPHFAKPVGAAPPAVDENKQGHIAKLLRAAPTTSAVGRVQVGGVPSRQPVPSRRDDGIPVAIRPDQHHPALTARRAPRLGRNGWDRQIRGAARVALRPLLFGRGWLLVGEVDVVGRQRGVASRAAVPYEEVIPGSRPQRNRIWARSDNQPGAASVSSRRSPAR
jgi:hypothetical protein